MTRVIRMGFALLFLAGCLLCSAAFAAGCSGESVPSDLSIRTIITEVAYQGHTYRPTSVRVGLERMSPENLTYAGTGFAPSEPPSSTAGSAGDTGYELYTIAGVDPAQAIAVKFIAVSLSGKGAPYWVWMRYEREQ